jgi:hypothetical protein
MNNPATYAFPGNEPASTSLEMRSLTAKFIRFASKAKPSCAPIDSAGAFANDRKIIAKIRTGAARDDR